MAEIEQENRDFLETLCRLTEGDESIEVSMYEVGAALGYEKSRAGELAEELIVDGYVDLKTLSGGISITAEGLSALDFQISARSVKYVSLGDSDVLDDNLLQPVEDVVAAVKQCVESSSLAYDEVEEMVIGIKVLQIYLLTARPKTSVIRELLRSVSPIILKSEDKELSERIEAMIRRE